MKRAEERVVTIDEVRNRAHRVGDAAGDLVEAVRNIPVGQRVAAAAAALAAAASAGFFMGSRRSKR